MTRLAAIRKPFGILARSLEIRTTAVLLAAILAVHGGASLLHRRSAATAAEDAFAVQMASQLSLAREAVLRRPPSERAAEAKALSTAHFEIGWSGAPTAQARTDPALRPLLERLKALDPGLGAGLSLALDADADSLHRNDLDGTLTLADASVLTFRSAHAPGVSDSVPWSVLATTMPVLVGIAAVLLIHWIAGPLRDWKVPATATPGEQASG